MLTYLISGAVALVLGTGGGFLGGRLANTNLRRQQFALMERVEITDAAIPKALESRPSRDELNAVFQNQQRGMAEVFVTREQLTPVLAEVVTRQELDMALTAVVTGISRNAGLPLPTPQTGNEAAALAGANGAQLANVIAQMSQQMGQINRQLGLG